MKINIKKLSSLAVSPWKAHLTDAGFDLYATSKHYDENGNVVYGCGLAFEIPEGARAAFDEMFKQDLDKLKEKYKVR